MTAHVHGLHVAQRFAEVFEHALHHGRPEDPAPRAIPPATDWPEWDWASKSGNGYEPEGINHDA